MRSLARIMIPAALALLIVFAGCAKQATESKAEEKLKSLTPGISYSQASQVLGGAGTEMKMTPPPAPAGSRVTPTTPPSSIKMYDWTLADGSKVRCTFKDDKLLGSTTMKE